MNSNHKKISIDELQRLCADELFEFIEGVTDDMAQNSDVGGDSDAEDDSFLSYILLFICCVYIFVILLYSELSCIL